MENSIDTNLSVSEKEEGVILEELKANNPELFRLISDTFVPDTGYSISDSYELVTDEGSYTVSPRTKELAAIAYAIKSKLPEVATGYTRVWRGNRDKEVGKNPSYTSSLIGIALPFLLSYRGPLSYVDVPTVILPSLQSGPAGTSVEYTVPKELLTGVQVVGFSKEDASALIANAEISREVQEGNNPWGATWA